MKPKIQDVGEVIIERVTLIKWRPGVRVYEIATTSKRSKVIFAIGDKNTECWLLPMEGSVGLRDVENKDAFTLVTFPKIDLSWGRASEYDKYGHTVVFFKRRYGTLRDRLWQIVYKISDTVRRV